jgi:hypothetical protein
MQIRTRELQVLDTIPEEEEEHILPSLSQPTASPTPLPSFSLSSTSLSSLPSLSVPGSVMSAGGVTLAPFSDSMTPSASSLINSSAASSTSTSVNGTTLPSPSALSFEEMQPELWDITSTDVQALIKRYQKEVNAGVVKTLRPFIDSPQHAIDYDIPANRMPEPLHKQAPLQSLKEILEYRSRYGSVSFTSASGTTETTASTKGKLPFLPKLVYDRKLWEKERRPAWSSPSSNNDAAAVNDSRTKKRRTDTTNGSSHGDKKDDKSLAFDSRFER